MKDPYAILGVRKDASAAELKAAYRRLARQRHPDADPGNPWAEDEFKELAAAYDLLSDPGRRAGFDRAQQGFQAARTKRRPEPAAKESPGRESPRREPPPGREQPRGQRREQLGRDDARHAVLEDERVHRRHDSSARCAASAGGARESVRSGASPPPSYENRARFRPNAPCGCSSRSAPAASASPQSRNNPSSSPAPTHSCLPTR